MSTTSPCPVSDTNLKLMQHIDKHHIEFPFAGSRMLQGLLVQPRFKVGRLHVATQMKRMGIEALYRKPNTSKPASGGHKIYPYLLQKLPITSPPGLDDGYHLHPGGAAYSGMAGIDHA